MPNEILSIQHTITQLQNVEKVQAVGQQREQYQQRAEALQQQEDKRLEQTIVQISEEAEKILLQDEGQEKEGEKRKGRHERTGPEEEPEGEKEDKVLDIIV